MVDSVEELQEALADPPGFLEKLATELGPEVAKKIVIAQLKPVLEPHLKKRGLTFEDVRPAIEMVDSVEELQAGLADPAGFLEKLLPPTQPDKKPDTTPDKKPTQPDKNNPDKKPDTDKAPDTTPDNTPPTEENSEGE